MSKEEANAGANDVWALFPETQRERQRDIVKRKILEKENVGHDDS